MYFCLDLKNFRQKFMKYWALVTQNMNITYHFHSQLPLYWYEPFEILWLQIWIMILTSILLIITQQT